MKNVKYFLFIFLLGSGTSFKAEIKFTHSIVDLAIYSDRIVEAKYIETNGNETKFLIKDILSQSSKYDTLILKNLDNIFYHLDHFKNAHSLVLFLAKDDKNGLHLVSSGVRLLMGSKIFSPFQSKNPGKYGFNIAQSDTIKNKDIWPRYLLTLNNVNKRIQYLKNLKNIQDLKLRNKELFKWIDSNKGGMGKNCGFNDDCGWGYFEFEIFKWITEANIANDTWRASELYRKINSKAEIESRHEDQILVDGDRSSFKNYKEIDFLFSKITSNKSSIVEKKQALSYLTRAVYCMLNYPSLIQEYEQKEIQKTIHSYILPLMGNPEMKAQEFNVIRYMSDPTDGYLDYKVDLEIIPLITEFYLKELPSQYKTELANFIVHNVNKAEWKKLTNCDEKMYYQIYGVYFDEKNNTLSFNIKHEFGKELIKEKPQVEIINSISNKVVLIEEVSKFNIEPYREVIESKIKNLNLDKGDYKVHVFGKAGENSEYHWETEFVSFEVIK